MSAIQSNMRFTISAADKVAMLIEEENDPKPNLRVVVNGGGCAGLQYSFTFDNTIQKDDIVIMQKSSSGKQIKLLVDFFSHEYLKDAEIDYVQSVQGEQFVIRNPNAKTTCGCGSSFSVDEE